MNPARANPTPKDHNSWPLLEMLRRFLVILAVGFWLGGFTFYAGVVIHTGHRVFGSARETGFLTQQVTHWLNLSGVVALAILLWNALGSSNQPGRWSKWALWLTWGLMAGLHVALYALHPVLDRMLDVETHHILGRAQFYRVHRVYMNLSTFQWAVGLLHTLLAMILWRARDLFQLTQHQSCKTASAEIPAAQESLAEAE